MNSTTGCSYMFWNMDYYYLQLKIEASMKVLGVGFLSTAHFRKVDIIIERVILSLT